MEFFSSAPNDTDIRADRYEHPHQSARIIKV